MEFLRLYVRQTSFSGISSGGVAKCRVFSGCMTLVSSLLIHLRVILIVARLISNIQGYTDEHDTILGSWLDDVLPSHGKWLHCFRSTSANWRGHQFHYACDGKGPTVVLIQVQQNVFGGFLDSQWGGKIPELPFVC